MNTPKIPQVPDDFKFLNNIITWNWKSFFLINLFHYNCIISKIKHFKYPRNVVVSERYSNKIAKSPVIFAYIYFTTIWWNFWTWQHMFWNQWENKSGKSIFQRKKLQSSLEWNMWRLRLWLGLDINPFLYLIRMDRISEGVLLLEI